MDVINVFRFNSLPVFLEKLLPIRVKVDRTMIYLIEFYIDNFM